MKKETATCFSSGAKLMQLHIHMLTIFYLQIVIVFLIIKLTCKHLYLNLKYFTLIITNCRTQLYGKSQLSGL